MMEKKQYPHDRALAITDRDGFTHWMSPFQMRQHPTPELKDITRDEDKPATDVPLICDPVPGSIDQGILICKRRLTEAEIVNLQAEWDRCNLSGGVMVLPPDIRMVAIFEPRQWPDAEFCAA